MIKFIVVVDLSPEIARESAIDILGSARVGGPNSESACYSIERDVRPGVIVNDGPPVRGEQ
jgi:hypothetical protein